MKDVSSDGGDGGVASPLVPRRPLNCCKRTSEEEEEEEECFMAISEIASAS